MIDFARARSKAGAAVLAPVLPEIVGDAMDIRPFEDHVEVVNFFEFTRTGSSRGPAKHLFKIADGLKMTEITDREDAPSGETTRPLGREGRDPEAPIHVLVVDDDVELLRVLVRGLEKKGFAVVSAATAHDALMLASSPDVFIDVIIMDLVLPDSWGPQAAMEQSLFQPDAPIIFISGYTEDDAVLQATASREICFLAKPFTVDELATLIRKVLEA